MSDAIINAPRVVGGARAPRLVYGFNRSLHEDPADKIAPEPVGSPPSEAFCGKLTPTKDQGNVGECGEYACISTLVHVGVKSDGVVREYSHDHLYQAYRKRMGIPLTLDSGTFLRELAQTVMEVGLVPAELWPDGVQDHWKLEAPPELDAEAEKHQALIPVRCVSVAMMKTSLAMGFPVFGGVLYPKNGDDPHAWATGEIFDHDGRPALGGHAMMCLGYDDNYKLSNGDTGIWIPQQSWGEGFGDNGLAKMSQKILWHDVWSFRAIEIPA